MRKEIIREVREYGFEEIFKGGVIVPFKEKWDSCSTTTKYVLDSMTEKDIDKIKNIWEKLVELGYIKNISKGRHGVTFTVFDIFIKSPYFKGSLSYGDGWLIDFYSNISDVVGYIGDTKYINGGSSIQLRTFEKGCEKTSFFKSVSCIEETLIRDGWNSSVPAREFAKFIVAIVMLQIYRKIKIGEER